MKKIPFILFVLFTTTFVGCKNDSLHDISLSGEWIVKLDSLNSGISDNWAATDWEGMPVTLPGTLDDAELGRPNTLEPAINNYVLSDLTRKHQYIGAA
jgi:hypothetical protein